MPAAVAVVVRTKNRTLLLERALTDIAEQTFRDVQVVIVNDGGDPEPVDAVILSARKELPALSVIHHERSLGREAASNAGIEATDSEFIAIHHDDDLWEPSFLDRTVALLRETGAMIAVTRVDEYFERYINGAYEFVESRPYWGQLPEVVIQDLFRANRTVPIATLYRRAVHDTLGPYAAELPVVGDWEFMMRAASKFPIEMIDETLAHWSHRIDATDEGTIAANLDDDLHQRYDARVRAREIRKNLAVADNIGQYLYQAHLSGLAEARDTETQASIADVSAQLREIAAQVQTMEDRQRHMAERQERIERAVSLRSRIRRAFRGRKKT